MAAAPPTPRAAEGQIDLLLAPAGGATRLQRGLAVPPLQLSRLRYDDPAHPGRACLTMVHLGGVLSGDRCRILVELADGADVAIGGAAATQVYTMPAGAAAQETTLRLGPGSRLLWLPAPLILFAGARFRQELRAELAPGALLVALDVMAPGRLARGEVFQFARFESRLEVLDRAGACLAAERACIEPGRADPAAAGLFGAAPVLGSLYLLGDGLDSEAICALAAPRCAGDAGAAVLPNGCGVLIRALGQSASAVRARLLGLYHALAGAHGVG
jgi:urease accessory protein